MGKTHGITITYNNNGFFLGENHGKTIEHCTENRKTHGKPPKSLVLNFS
jgi:hypothetical protein